MPSAGTQQTTTDTTDNAQAITSTATVTTTTTTVGKLLAPDTLDLRRASNLTVIGHARRSVTTSARLDGNDDDNKDDDDDNVQGNDPVSQHGVNTTTDAIGTRTLVATSLGPGMKLVPPLNFAIVQPGVYRSGFPNRRNFQFLQRLGLRTVVYFCADELLEENRVFLRDAGISFVHIRCAGNKEPFVAIKAEDVRAGIECILDVRNHPVLVHCNRGCHRVGCLMGILRKLQQWSMPSIFEEYRRFSGQTVHVPDQDSIESFDVQPLLTTLCNPSSRRHLPPWFIASLPRHLM